MDNDTAAKHLQAAITFVSLMIESDLHCEAEDFTELCCHWLHTND